MHLRRPFVLLVILALSLAAGTSSSATEPALASGIDRANFDTSVQPGQDFFEYVNGGWIKRNPIPAEYSRWGAFAKLHDENLVELRAIVEELSKRSEPLDANRRKLRDFYHTAMDEAQLEQQGIKPLAGELQKIAAIHDRNDLVAELGHLRARGLSSLFAFYVDQDEKRSIRYVAYLRQGGLGLPERDYYLGQSEYFKKLRGEYRAHIANMLMLLGDSPETAANAAEAITNIETQLAKASRSPVKLRDREAQYNLKSRPELNTLTPSLDWKLYLKPIELEQLSEAVVGQPEFFEALDGMLSSIPIADWQSYLRWHLIHSTAVYLSDAIEQENFHFYSEILRGTKKMQPRWKRAIGTLDGLMGEALGRLYVDEHFPPSAKERMDQLVKNVLAAYRQRIEAVDWMGPQTKEQALAKLASVMTKIGYPDKWRDYSSLQIGTDSYVENVLRARAFDSQYDLSKLGKRVDRTEWGMSPPTVNAYYNPTMNEIVFPAGILQQPFFDAAADDAVNYGAIGAVIGHEITHGFDDQGSRSDAEGNLKNWWTTEDRERFNAKTEKLVKQYDACVAIDDLHVNGRLTLGENLADLGGVTIAYAAYQRALAGKPAPRIDGFTGPQRFFIGFAQVWRGESRPAELRVSLRTDPHSPPRFRTLVPLSNIQAFYDAFDIKPGDAMYRAPADRVQVW
ncbi:MAG TPA: M13 family metallopeptidase [Pirellulales bacterium]|nr:M13 family metallopeptidase [Pirellulales bacterium]